MTEHDPVNHPTHYASDSTCASCGESIECIEVVRHLSFTRGNAIKYLWRAGAKGDTVEDLKKAIWYIQDEIAYLEGKPNPNVHRLSQMPIGKIESITETEEGLQVSADLRACVYSFEDGDYRCMTHGMQSTKHHPTVGVNRPCRWIDPGE